MPKIAPAILDDPPPPRRPAIRSALVFVLGLALAPVVYEAALVCAANWRAMSGAPEFVRTPVLDAVVGFYDSSSESLRISVSSFFRDLPWRPEHVLLVAFGWAAGGSLLLRSRLRR